MNDNYKLPDNLINKLDTYFLSQDNSFSDWNKWSLVSFLKYADEKKPLSFSDKRELHRRRVRSVSICFGSKLATPLSDNASTATPQHYITTTPPRHAPQPLLQDASTTTPPLGNASTAPLPHYTPTTPPRNAPSPPPQNILKRSFDIYETSYEMDWAPWNFDITINDVNIECVLKSLHERCQKTNPKTKTSLEYGIIDLNDGIILEALGQSVILHFEKNMQEYKHKKALSVEMRILKTFNVTSLEDLGNALDKVKIDYNNLDHDIIYLRRLFEKLGEVEMKALCKSFLIKNQLSFQDKSTINLDNRDLLEGWYNSHIVAPIFDDCLKSMDECILRCRQFEFIYVETATTSVLSKSDKDLSKLHNAIILMFKHMVSTLPEKLLHEISSVPILCVQFSAEEITTFSKMTKVAAKMLSLQPFIQDLHKRYQTSLAKEADYYLEDDNT
ncbi:hypothetical protein F8M41_004435 [Gigaspora margarita]|uniref:Uncharacterized protein n=1 Tax=Gigaspora margarita TaxID=4874 RepID=A0A8H4ERS8_GIGMA|nr:hypothetical protein F8M41_004435 [Gigaspora margarita]